MQQFGRFVSLAILFFSLSAPILLADDYYEEQIYEQLDAAAYEFKSAGYTLDEVPGMGVLEEDQIEFVDINMRGDREYIILGVCDEDCSDLDLLLYDEEGNLIERDQLADDAPVIEGTPTWTGPFRIKVEMVSCGAGNCVWGVGIYVR